jgi:hypothetical protein
VARSFARPKALGKKTRSGIDPRPVCQQSTRSIISNVSYQSRTPPRSSSSVSSSGLLLVHLVARRGRGPLRRGERVERDAARLVDARREATLPLRDGGVQTRPFSSLPLSRVIVSTYACST